MTDTLVDCSSSAEYEEIQKHKWFKYKEPITNFQNCGMVDPRHIEVIKIGTKDMTIGDMFNLLQQQVEYIPLNHCMSDYISKNPADESLKHLPPVCMDGHALFFFGSMFENYFSTDKWVVSIEYSRRGSAINYQKRHLHEGWYPDYWNVAVIRK